MNKRRFCSTFGLTQLKHDLLAQDFAGFTFPLFAFPSMHHNRAGQKKILDHLGGVDWCSDPFNACSFIIFVRTIGDGWQQKNP